MKWQQHDIFGGQSATVNNTEYLVIPNADTGKWEVWMDGHKQPGSFHTQSLAKQIAEQTAEAR